MFRHDALELGDDLAMKTASQISVDPVAERSQARWVEPGGLCADKRQ
jgi:hypothetical protein